MSRLVPCLLSSVGAHVVVLALLQVPLSAPASTPAVVPVSAVLRSRALETERREETPPRLEEEVAEHPTAPRRRLTKAPEHRPLPQREPPPVRSLEPPQKVVPEPPEDELPPPSQTAAVAHQSAGLAAVPSGARGQSIAVASGALDRTGGASARATSEPRRRPREDPCPAARAAVIRRMRASTPYPAWAHELGLEGRLRVSLRVGRDGRPRGVRIVTTSGHTGLDRYVMSAIRDLDDLPSGCRQPLSIQVTLRSR